MPAYPASLPQKAFMSATDERQTATIRSNMEAGAPKVRKLFTAAVRNLKVKMILTGTQRATFDTFFITTIGEGSGSFTIPDPVDDSTITVRFRKPPSWSYVEGSGSSASNRLWSSTYELEVLP